MHAQAHDLPASNGRSNGFANQQQRHHQNRAASSSSMVTCEEERQWQALAQAILKIKQAECPFTPNLSLRNPSPEAAQRLRSQAQIQLGVQLDQGWVYYPGVRAPSADGPKYDPCITHPALQPSGYFRSSVSVIRFLQLLQQQGAELPGVVGNSSSSHGAGGSTSRSGRDAKRQAAAVAAALQVIGKSFVQPRVVGGGRSRSGWGSCSRQQQVQHSQHVRQAPAAAKPAAQLAAAAAASNAGQGCTPEQAAGESELPGAGDDCYNTDGARGVQQPEEQLLQQPEEQQREPLEEQQEHQHEPQQEPQSASGGMQQQGEQQQGSVQQIGHKRSSPCAEEHETGHCNGHVTSSSPAAALPAETGVTGAAEPEAGEETEPLPKRHNAAGSAGASPAAAGIAGLVVA